MRILSRCAALACIAGGILGACGTAQAVPLHPTVTTINPSSNPVDLSVSVTFTATVINDDSSGLTVNGGTVDFEDGIFSIAGCAAVSVSNGTATCTTTFPTPGAFVITAAYSGFTPSEGEGLGASSGFLDEDVVNPTASVPLPGSATFLLPGLMVLTGFAFLRRRSKIA